MQPPPAGLRRLAGEGARYFVAGGLAFALDFSVYVALIRLADVHYLLAAPFAFAAGIAVTYLLCIRWVFAERRLADARTELGLFVAIGLAGMAFNEAVLFAAVDRWGLAFEPAKLISAAVVFGFNFLARKFLLFTRY